MVLILFTVLMVPILKLISTLLLVSITILLIGKILDVFVFWYMLIWFDSGLLKELNSWLMAKSSVLLKMTMIVIKKAIVLILPMLRKYLFLFLSSYIPALYSYISWFSAIQIGVWDASTVSSTAEWAKGPIDWNKGETISATVKSVTVKCNSEYNDVNQD